MLIVNLHGVFTCSGFAAKDGRRPVAVDMGLLTGPVGIRIDADFGKIQEVGSNLAAMPGEVVIDGEGMVALPGFIDPHTHALFAGDRSGEFFQRWKGATYQEINASGGGIHKTVTTTMNATDAVLRDFLRERLKAFRKSGTTLVEVKTGYGESAEDELRLLKILDSLRCEEGLPGVVPTYLGLHALPRNCNESDFCNEHIEALVQVAALGLADGVDSFPEGGFFSRDSAVRFSQIARNMGLGVHVHADELSDLGTTGLFAEMGALSVDHLQNASGESIQKLAASVTTAVLLPATSFYLGLPYTDARKLLDAGGRVALATDYNPGTAPSHDFQLTNLLAAAQLNMSSAEILCACTYNAATALGKEQLYGVLAPGYSADIQLYRVDFAGNLHDLPERIIISRQQPETVLVRGLFLPRE